MMIRTGCLVLTALILLIASACEKIDTDTSQIKEAAATLHKAFTEGDAEKLKAVLADDAVDYNLTTQETIVGKDNVAHFLTSLFAKNEMPQISISIEKILRKSSGTMQVQGLLRLTLPTQTHEDVAFTLAFKKSEKGWLITQITHLLLQPPPSHYEQLKDLAWFIGNWVNSDEDTHFTATYSWDMNNNYIKEEFNVTVLSHKQLTGLQIVAWDPVRKCIRSWIYDSDGGYGDSFWSNEDGVWYATTTYTLADGRKASATHIYTYVNNSTYTFSSIARDVDGKMLPNIGPFTVTKTYRVGS